MDNNQVVFSFEKMREKLQQMEQQYELFYTAINTMDIEVSQAIQINSSSAVYGNGRGKKLYDAWSTKCAPFKKFYYLFREWSAKVTQAFQKYADMQAEVSGTPGENKLEYDDIERSITADPNEADSARKLKALQQGLVEIDGQPLNFTPANGTVAGQPGQYMVDVNGTQYPVMIDENGNLTSVTVGNTTYEVSHDTVEQQAASIIESCKDNPKQLTQIKKELEQNGDRELLLAINNQQTQAQLTPSADILSAAQNSVADNGTIQIDTNIDPNSTSPGNQLYNQTCEVLSTCTEEAAKLYYAMQDGTLFAAIDNLKNENPTAASYVLDVMLTSYEKSDEMRRTLQGDLKVSAFVIDGGIGNARETNNAYRRGDALDVGIALANERNQTLAEISSIESIDRMLESYGLPTISSYCEGTNAYKHYEGYRENVEGDRTVK